jgi:NhaA family Na+:H+ antiporter
VWARECVVGIVPYVARTPLHHLINDGLMAVFFFVVGLEIAREFVDGELRERRAATLPVVAALGGMVVPALLYTALNAGGTGAHAWAVPMATDVAFAVGVLALFPGRVPRGAKVFLLTLAIVDDIGSIAVIAVFYSSGVAPEWLLGAAGAVVVIVVLRRLGVAAPLAYVVPAIALWACLLASGVQAAIAGVALGLLTPVRAFHGRDVHGPLEAGLHPWSSFLVMPVFALANAGVVVSGDGLGRALRSPIAWGIVAALVAGKPVGILAGTAVVRALDRRPFPDGLAWRDLAGVAVVAGMGITVSIFVAGLSFTGPHLEDAKLAILVASLVCALAAAAIIVVVSRRSDHRDLR